MPTIVKDYEFRTQRGNTRYPWPMLTDGEKRLITADELAEWGSDAKKFKATAKNHATRNGFHVLVDVEDNGDVYIQFVKREDNGAAAEEPAEAEAKPKTTRKATTRKRTTADK